MPYLVYVNMWLGSYQILLIICLGTLVCSSGRIDISMLNRSCDIGLLQKQGLPTRLISWSMNCLQTQQDYL